MKRIHPVRVRGGNLKYRALRLDSGNFAWGSEHVTRKTRIISVVCISLLCIFFGNDAHVLQVYNASNNELVRTNTLVKGAIIQVDAAPFRQWYETHVRSLSSGVGEISLSILVRPTSDKEGHQGGGCGGGEKGW